MASFSNEFEFDPLRGPVKTFTQILFDDQGEMVKRVRAQVSAEGCFDLLDFTDLENKTGATLILDANYYLDAQTQEKRCGCRGNASSPRCRRRASAGRPMTTALW